MPVINGRLHLPKQSLTPRQKWVHGIGVGVAILFVAVSWWITAGQSALTTFVAGVGSGVGGVVEQADAMRGEAVETGSPGITAAQEIVSDLLKEAQAKKAAADMVAETLNASTP